MKTKLFLIMLVGFFMAGCSKNNNNVAEEPLNGKIVIDLSSAVNITTKSIYSQEATNRVNKVVIYVYESVSGGPYEFRRTYSVDNWDRGTTFKRYEIAAGDAPAAGTYIFMAVGEEEGSDYVIKAEGNLTDAIALLEKKIGRTEVFAGLSAPTVVSPDGVRVGLEMKRKVSGIMAYFSNVPKEISSKKVGYLRLYALRANRVVGCETGTGSETEDAEFVIIDFDLTSQADASGVFVGNDLSGTGVSKLKNTQLGGTYILPIDKTHFVLRLLDTDQNELRAWKVTYNNNFGYELTANTLYRLGVKPTLGSTTGDEPIDLMQQYVLALSLDPNWGGIGDLIIQ